MAQEKNIYPIFKGLQRPLVFRMFKGRFIYMGLGGLGASIFIGGLVCGLVNNIIGVIVIVGIAIPTLIYTLNEQKKGIYRRSKQFGIFMIKPRQISKQKHEQKTHV